MLTCTAVIGASEKVKTLLKSTPSSLCYAPDRTEGSKRKLRKHKQKEPDVRGSAYSPQRFRPGVHVLRVLGVGDEHHGPLLKPQVSEAEQVVVDCQKPVPADRQVPPEAAWASPGSGRTNRTSPTCGCPSSPPAPAPGFRAGAGCAGRASGLPACADGRKGKRPRNWKTDVSSRLGHADREEPVQWLRRLPHHLPETWRRRDDGGSGVVAKPDRLVAAQALGSKPVQQVHLSLSHARGKKAATAFNNTPTDTALPRQDSVPAPGSRKSCTASWVPG